MGIREEGIDLACADAVIGTSAGSFVGAYLATDTVAEYYAKQFSDDSVEISTTMSPETVAGWERAFDKGGDDLTATARELGRLALSTPTVSNQARAEVVSSRLPTSEWPAGNLQVTAIDAESGLLHLLDKHSGLTLEMAVSASGAVPGVWPAVRASGRIWIDGGSCSAANLALGAGYDKVVAIVPVEGFPGRRGAREDLADLAAAGAHAILIVPDPRSSEALGVNMFDAGRRAPSAQAGRLQGREVAARVSAVWT